ncbi:MAG: hypothetical protein U1E10_02055 [Bdellovibrionales bacterium]|nr:hypothetical protein [Bdellovibrionales bacterium]
MSSRRSAPAWGYFLVPVFMGTVFVGCQTKTPKISLNTVSEMVSGRAPSFSVVEENEELNSKERLAWLQGRKNYLKSLYQERLDPYFGKADEQVASCEIKAVKQAEEKSNADVSYVSYSILTTDAGATGVCDPKMQTHRMALVFAACANRHLQFTLKLICPNSAGADDRLCRISEKQVAQYCFERKITGVEI